MLHKQVATTVEATEAGTFVALAAAYTVDRSNERVMPGAFWETIKRWREVGRNVPLHWDHESDPESIVGTVDPLSMEETSDGLRVEATLDLEESALARQVWRLVKSDSVGLSFGYLVTDERERGDVRELHKIDLFEVSLTPAPMNPEARVLSWKSSVLADQERYEREFLRIAQRPFIPDPVEEKTATPKPTEPMTVERFEC